MRSFGQLRRSDAGYIENRLLKMETPRLRERGVPHQRLMYVVKGRHNGVTVTGKEGDGRKMENKDLLCRVFSGNNLKIRSLLFSLPMERRLYDVSEKYKSIKVRELSIMKSEWEAKLALQGHRQRQIQNRARKLHTHKKGRF